MVYFQGVVWVGCGSLETRAFDEETREQNVMKLMIVVTLMHGAYCKLMAFRCMNYDTNLGNNV